jgi:hypothetical protein
MMLRAMAVSLCQAVKNDREPVEGASVMEYVLHKLLEQALGKEEMLRLAGAGLILYAGYGLIKCIQRINKALRRRVPKPQASDWMMPTYLRDYNTAVNDAIRRTRTKEVVAGLVFASMCVLGAVAGGALVLNVIEYPKPVAKPLYELKTPEAPFVLPPDWQKHKVPDGLPRDWQKQLGPQPPKPPL